MSPLQKRFSYLLSVLSVLLVIAVAAAVWGWWQMRGSLPQLDGGRALAGLGAPVKVERDALGVPTITGVTRTDVARATGFVHAQDRFFQMDLLRRSGAGELAEIFGTVALPLDRAHRLHGFRHTAEKVVAALPADQRAVLEAYTAGVNVGLAALPKIPWEYLVLRTPPQPWRAEDSILVSYAMWFDLQDATGRLEQNLRGVQSTLGLAGMNFFAPQGDSWDAALDGSTFAPASLPPLRLIPPEEEKVGALVPNGPHAGTTPSVLPDSAPSFVLCALSSESSLPGSNSFAVDGAHTASGAALLANDMHLSLNVPAIWYRAVFNWRDASGTAHRVAGVTLPGTPLMIIGSNGHIAWGFTNAYIDTSDVVLVEAESIAQVHYRTAHGWVEIEDRSDPIKVKGQEPVPFTARWTEWGPILSGPEDGRYLALRWNAHEVESTNLNLIELETATTATDAVHIAHRTGMPNQNLLVADASGAIAWTLTGTIPRRVGYDGRVPVSWAFGDRHWDGWLKLDEIPVIANPAEGILWTANQRLVGGAALAKIGDSGYGGGARGGQIRDDLRQLIASGKKAMPADLLSIQLDDRAVYLGRWQKFLLGVLTDEAVAKKSARADLRDAVRQWNGRASTDSAAYRLVRSYRLKLADRVLAPFFEKATDNDERFSYSQFHYEDALWRLVQEKPLRMLNPAHKSWESLLLAAADDVIADADKEGVPLKRFTWGRRNTLRMQHPFSSFLPGPLARLLDMPVEPLPGDNDMPRVQGRAFGASERLVVSPGHENEAIFHMPGGQSGHPLSPYYRSGHEAWVKGEPTPLLPGPAQHTLMLNP
jgi:penicillin amidase